MGLCLQGQDQGPLWVRENDTIKRNKLFENFKKLEKLSWNVLFVIETHKFWVLIEPFWTALYCLYCWYYMYVGKD